MKIGIPRALYYYHYPALWEKFILLLGMEPILSSSTSTKTIERAALISETENCLPVKLFDAHVASLLERADTILIPRIISMMKGRCSCPKLGALPDVAYAHLRDRAKILSFTIDENREPLIKTVTNLGVSLGIHRGHSKMAAQEAMELMHARRRTIGSDSGGGASNRILLLSHPYIIQDEYLVGPILRKLEDLNMIVFSPATSESGQPPELSAWDSSSLMHQTLMDLDPDSLSGVIQLSSFNCGCDSIMVEFFRELLRDKMIPYMVLVMDEHSAQGGLDTRLEAFVDSMEW